MELAKLAEPFPVDAVHWRIGSTNKDKTRAIALAYLDARDVMDRLDSVLGPENWQDCYDFEGPRIICTLSVLIGERWIAKSDAAGDTSIEAEKGGVSDAFKRAAVKWGVGRYLYRLSSPWVEIEGPEKYKKIKPSELPKLRALLNGGPLRVSQPEVTPPASPPSVSPGVRVKDYMELRCEELGVDPKDYAMGALKSILRHLEIPNRNNAKAIAEREDDIRAAIDAWKPPSDADSKEFAEGAPGPEGEDKRPPQPQEEATEKLTVGGSPKLLRSLHAFAKELGFDGDEGHRMLHNALPPGVTSLKDLPVSAAGNLKFRLRELAESAAMPAEEGVF